MKKIKYLVCFLLIIAGFIFNGELFVLYLDNFQESYYRASFAMDDLPVTVPNDEIIEDFIGAGRAHNVEFFMISSNIKSAYYEEITIYGTEKALQSIEGKGIMEKEYPSLLMGKVNVRFEHFKNIKAIDTYENCYFIGGHDNYENIRAFKADLIDQYGGGFPKLYGSEDELKLNILTVWLMILSIILLLTLYDVLFQKREVAVRVVFGEELKMIILKNILFDTSALSLFFLVIPKAFNHATNVYFQMSYILHLFVVLIILNTLIHLTLLFVNFKKSFARNTSSWFLMFVNYSPKTIVSILVVLILSSNGIAISKGIDYYKQRSFFEAHKEYSYYRLNYRITNKNKTYEDENLMNQEFYIKHQNRSLLYCDLSQNFSANYPIIWVNNNAMDQLVSEWSSLAKMKAEFNDEGYYILVPDHIPLDSREFNYAKQNFDCLFNNDGSTQAKVLRYKEDLDVVGIANQANFESTVMKNPIIIYDNSITKTDLDAASDFMSIAYSAMYKIPEDDFRTFVEENQLENQIVVQSNVLDVYAYNWSILSRTMKIVTLLSVFLIILEIAMIAFIIQMEYKLNVAEMAVKKILGYSVLERNKRLVQATIISAIIGFIAVLTLIILLKMKGSMSVLWGVPLLLVFELLYISNKAKAIEMRNIPAVLKGERI